MTTPKWGNGALAAELVHDIVASVRHGGKVLICGNGGLAAESEHFAAELVGKFGRDVYAPCIALTGNSSVVTALSNDFGYDQLFAHQACVLGRQGDVLIAMTTSRSPNIVNALMAGRERGLITAVLCGEQSGQFDATHTVRLHGEESAAMQQDALSFLHYLAYNIKREMLK